jgi:hypothetical protein
MLGETFETGVGVPGVGFGIGGLTQFEVNDMPSTTSIRRKVILTVSKSYQGSERPSDPGGQTPAIDADYGKSKLSSSVGELITTESLLSMPVARGDFWQN